MSAPTLFLDVQPAQHHARVDVNINRTQLPNDLLRRKMLAGHMSPAFPDGIQSREILSQILG